MARCAPHYVLAFVVHTPTVADLVRSRADDTSVGLRFEDATWTWQEIVREAATRAALLESLRVDGPFHVGVLLENVPEYLFVLAGAALAGATVVGINPTRRGEELARDIRHTDCQLVITETVQRGDLDGLDLGLALDRIHVDDSNRYRALVDSHRDAPLPDRLPDPGDLYLLIFTSG